MDNDMDRTLLQLRIMEVMLKTRDELIAELLSAESKILVLNKSLDKAIHLMTSDQWREFQAWVREQTAAAQRRAQENKEAIDASSQTDL